MSQRILPYVLMGVVSPAILFTFAVVFGADSYQVWGDRFHLSLTGRYLFTRLHMETVLGPLWREDVLSGNIWAGLGGGPPPLAFPILMGRLLQLSPVWIDFIGNLTLYFVSVVSMYVYLRRVVGVGREGATAAAVMFAAAVYWIAVIWVEDPDLPMAVAGLPAMLVMAHRVERAVEGGSSARLVEAVAGLAIVVYLCALHSTLASVPIALLLVIVYIGVVCGLGRTWGWALVALGLGVVLFAPFLWQIGDAVNMSRRGVDPGFVLADVGEHWDPLGWLAREVRASRYLFLQIVVGHNQFGVFFVVMLVGVVGWGLGCSWGRERLRLRRILQFAGGAAGVVILLGIFHTTIDYLKSGIPLLGGWHVHRFLFFFCFFLLILVAWVLDRVCFDPAEESRSRDRKRALRVAVIMAGIVGGGQIVYSAVRMQLVPAAIYPQNVVLYGYLGLYAVVTGAVVGLLYWRMGWPAGSSVALCPTAARGGVMVLLVLSVSLTTSVHTYRASVLPLVPKTGVAGPVDPVMTYAQRYTVPEDIMSIKRLSASDGRIVDLTRPWRADGLRGTEMVLLPLAGLRTPSGHNTVIPHWYDRFIFAGIGGRPSHYSWYIMQIENPDRANFEVLGLLDVQYVLAYEGANLPGYVPVRHLKASGKSIYAAEKPDLVGPAFLSPDIVCFPNDTDALNYIHQADLRALRSRTVLVSRDPAAAPFCNENESTNPVQGARPRIQVHRGQDQVRLEIESDIKGIVTLADTYYPGWKVYVDGVEKPVVRTYTTLRGVVVESGRHSVEFVYEPRMFWLLVRLSNGLLMGLLLAILVARWWEKSAERTMRSW